MVSESCLEVDLMATEVAIEDPGSSDIELEGSFDVDLVLTEIGVEGCLTVLEDEVGLAPIQVELEIDLGLLESVAAVAENDLLNLCPLS